MPTLGTWPEDRYYLSWMAQRIANRAPEYTQLRRWPFSVGQQLLNPISTDIQRVHQQLIEERLNIFLTSADINLLDQLYEVELGTGMSFVYIEDQDGIAIYRTPSVYVTIDSTEYQLTIAKQNNIESLAYTALPSRIEDGEESYSYTEVIPRMTLAELATATPNTLPIYGHLYVTIRDNNTWFYNGRTKKYYPKVFITGITRKDTILTEAIPIQYNGTFKSVNQWKAVTEVFVSYMDETASITVEVLPFDQVNTIDTRNLVVPVNGVESWRFNRLGSKAWGSTLISEGFTVGDIETIQLGFGEKDTEYEIELQDELSNNVTLTGAAWKPNTNYVFVIDNSNLYIYDTRIPYPNMTVLEPESSDTKMDLYADRWVNTRDDTIIVQTDNLDVTNIPWRYRWTLQYPSGTKLYLAEDGSTIPLTSDAWIDNIGWEYGTWHEQSMELLLSDSGTYIITIECLYSDPDYPQRDVTKTTRFMLYNPVITPEITLSLPTALQNATGVMFDADGKLWFLIDNALYLSNVFYDYFIADYERNVILLRENYSSVRVVI